MNKAILISISPEKCMRIADGRQIVLLTKKKPNISTPFKVFIYETKAVNRSQIVVDIDGDQPTVYAKGRGKVIGEFVCERITMPEPVGGIVYCSEYKQACLSFEEIINFLGQFYALHISSLVIYNEPKALSEFHKKAPCKYYRDSKVSVLDKCFYDFPCEHIGEFETYCQGERIKHPPRTWCYCYSLHKTKSKRGT